MRVAISPIIGGKALKGPADKMLRTLGHESSALGIARIYLEIIDAFIFDEQDAGLMPEISQLWPRSYTRQTIRLTVAIARVSPAKCWRSRAQSKRQVQHGDAWYGRDHSDPLIC